MCIRDSVSVKVNAVVFFRVVDPQKAIIQVEDFLMATSQLAQTTLRVVLGKHELDEMLAERERLNTDVQKIQMCIRDRSITMLPEVVVGAASTAAVSAIAFIIDDLENLRISDAR